MGFTKSSCEEFVDVLASKAPVPGGGGASALVGAIGMALGNMVGSLTVGKKKYADVEADIIALKEKATALQADFLRLVEADDSEPCTCPRIWASCLHEGTYFGACIWRAAIHEQK